MNYTQSNPFEFKYDEQTNSVITKSNFKFYRENNNLDKTKEYIKIIFSIYKIEKPIDYFTWLNEPDSETNYNLELFFEIDVKFAELFKKIKIDTNNSDNNMISFELEESELNSSWFNTWYLSSRFANENIKMYDTYIPTSIEYIRFI